MVDTELESKIRQTIEETYCCKTTFPIKAKVVDGTYIVYLYLTNQLIDPMHVIWEGESEEAFLEWLKRDLKERNLLRSTFIKIELENDQQV